MTQRHSTGSETGEKWASPYVGEGLRLYTRCLGDEREICFTFDQYDNVGTPPALPGAGLLEREGIAHAHLSTLGNDWYQSPDLSKAVAVLSDLRARYDRATTYGGSMGGYAALLFSRLLGADRAVALGPQFSIDPAKAPFETRWTAVARSLSFAYDTMAEALEGPCRRIVVYDPACFLDKLHCDLIRAHGQVEVYRLPFCGHYPLQVVRGHVTEFVRELLLGEARPGVLAPLRRLGRLDSSRYFNEMAAWFAARGNTPAAFGCLARAYAVDPASTSVLETTFQVMQSQPAYTRVLQHMLLRLIRHEQPHWTHYAGAEAQIWSAIRKDCEPVSRNP